MARPSPKPRSNQRSAPYSAPQPGLQKEYAQQQTSTYPEPVLAQITRDEGFELEYIVRSSPDDWDRYISDSWRALIGWLEENPNHPDYEQVFKYFHADQDDYLKYQRQYMGWAMYCLVPMQTR